MVSMGKKSEYPRCETVRTENGFTVSMGNGKMGLIPSFSITPVRTCPKDAPCKAECYAVRMGNRCRTVGESWIKNMRTLYEAGYDRFVEDIEKFCWTYEPRCFRWNVAGDIFCKEYLEAIVEIAVRCPETKFFLFTKQYAVVEENLDIGRKPSNLTVYVSVWGDYAPAQNSPLWELPIAYYQSLKDKILCPDESARVCTGDCMRCKHCTHGTAGNVVFDKH